MLQWDSAGLDVWLTESLRTWNSLTSAWRQDMIVTPQRGVWWYDLAAEAGSPRPYTVTDTDLITAVERHLLEPVTGTYPLVWTGSTQFSLADVLRAITARRNEVLSVTGCAVAPTIVSAPIAMRFMVPDNFADIQRVAWLPVAGMGFTGGVLRQSDRESKANYDWTYTTSAQAPPNTWMTTAEPPLMIDVDRVPPVPGQYECLAVIAEPAVSASAPATFTIPDDWLWVVKFGALSELLSREGNAKDPLRAKYCAVRFEQGMALLDQAAAVLAARINNIPVPVDSVRNGDDFNPSWQFLAEGAPTEIYSTGNLIGMRAPDSSVAYSATITVVTNAPIDAVYFQSARGDYAVILDYAQHLASFQMGGAEFAATFPLYSKFLRSAGLFNSRVLAFGDYPRSMYEISTREEQGAPRYGSVSPAEKMDG
jgi:hypothetical protein